MRVVVRSAELGIGQSFNAAVMRIRLERAAGELTSLPRPKQLTARSLDVVVAGPRDWCGSGGGVFSLVLLPADPTLAASKRASS